MKAISILLFSVNCFAASGIGLNVTNTKSGKQQRCVLHENDEYDVTVSGTKYKINVDHRGEKLDVRVYEMANGYDKVILYFDGMSIPTTAIGWQMGEDLSSFGPNRIGVEIVNFGGGSSPVLDYYRRMFSEAEKCAGK